ncbi:radical SAM protein [Candidatus Dependentiae bacterium]|nr:radical SAM protein [Candidatus Dependentiae bacterium]
MNNNIIKINKRVDIYPTFACNIECKFCYYKFKKYREQRSFEDVKNEIDIFKQNYQIKYFDITGGEPTVYKEIIKMVKYCRERLILPTIITNGQKTETIKNLVSEGLEDVLLSYHDYESHYDEITNRNNAYKNLMNSVEYLHSINFSFRTNTVVTKFNGDRLTEIAKKLTSIVKPRIANFIIFNPHPATDWSNKENIPFQGRYTDLSVNIKKALNIMIDNNIYTNVRYIPLCCMGEYEKYVCNFHQWQWDPYEWNVRACMKLDEKFWKYKLPFKSFFTKLKLSNLEEKKILWLIKNRFCHNNIYLEKCRECDFYYICDGIYPQYLKNFGDEEFIPVKKIGKILDPIMFRKKDLRWNDLKNK